MAERIAAQLETALRGAAESIQLAFNQIATEEIRLEPNEAVTAATLVALNGLSTAGLLILIECQDGQHWVLACPASELLPISPNLTTEQLQAILDAIREAVCSTLSVVVTHVLFSRDLSETVLRAKPTAKLDVISLRMQAESDERACRMLGPLPYAKGVLPPRPVPATEPYGSLEEGLEQLPPYAKSLLKVGVPISVTLASTKKPVSSIVSLGPGAIIQFKKSCDEMLSLEVAGLPIAEGEAVKVGDKFGLWITEIKLPDERFRRLQDLV